MRKGIALFCTVFVLVSSGYAQSNRVGVYATPQGNVLGKITKDWVLDLSRKEKGLMLGEGIYYERCGNLSGLTIGLGFTQVRNTYTSDLRIGEGTNQMNFISLLLSGNTNFHDGDKFKVGMQYGFQFHYLLKWSQDGLEWDFSDREGYERLALTINVGASFTYLFTDNIGISVTLPSVSLLGRSTHDEPYIYWGFGGQIRLFYAFGY